MSEANTLKGEVLCVGWFWFWWVFFVFFDGFYSCLLGVWVEYYGCMMVFWVFLLCCLLGVWAGFPLLFRWFRFRRAVSGVRFFVLHPLGSPPVSWDAPTSGLAADIQNLAGGVLSSGGFVLHRWVRDGVLSLGVSVWGVEDPVRFVESFARHVHASFEEGEPEFLVDGQELFVWNRGGFQQSVSAAGDNVTRCAEELSSVLVSEDNMSLHVGVQPMSRQEAAAYKKHVGLNKDTSQQINQALGTLTRSSVVVLGGSELSAGELGGGVFSQIPNYLHEVRKVRVNDRGFAGFLLFFGFAFGLLSLFSLWFLLVSAVFVGLFVSVFFGFVSFREHFFRESLHAGLVFAPSAFRLSPSNVFMALLKAFLTPDDSDVSETPVRVSHKLSGWSERVHPFNSGHIVALSLFPGNLFTQSESAGTLTNAAPVALTEAVGLPFGKDISGKWVKIPGKDREGGIFVAGEAGSGKTVALHGVWHGDIVNKLGNSKDHTLVWVETKGEGAEEAVDIARKAGVSDDDLLVLDVNVVGKSINFVEHGDVLRSAELLTQAMKYGFAQGDIMGQAENVLKSALFLALSIPDSVLSKFNKRPSVMDIAFMLVGGNEKNYKKFMHMLKREVLEDDDVDSDSTGISDIFDESEDFFVEALKNWEQFDSKSDKDRLSITQSSLNRISVLRNQKHLWFPQGISLEDIISSYKVVVVNFGSAMFSEEALEPNVKAASERLAAMFLYMLWDTVGKVCPHWNREGKGLFVYSDELSMIAKDGGDGTNIVESMRDQGRSYGMKLNFATQRIDQLEPNTKAAVLSFKHKTYLSTETPEQAEQAVNDLTGKQEDSYSPQDIRNLPKGQGIARLTVDSVPQPPFNIFFQMPEMLDAEETLEAWRGR